MIVVLAALAGVVGCSKDDPANGPSVTFGATQMEGLADGGVLSIAVPSTPASWSPTAAWTTADLQAARGVYDRLMVRDDNGIVVPELAEKVSATANQSVWTIVVRRGITFSDGTALDAAVVAANLQAQVTSSANGGLLDPVASVVVTNPTTVTVTMYAPWSTFPEVLSTRIGTIAAVPTLTGAVAAPIGTGPFTYRGTEPDGTVVLVHNVTYWRSGLPRLDEVRFVPIPDASERVDAVLAGRVQMVAVDEPRQLSRVDTLVSNGTKLVVHEDRNAERPKVDIALETGRAPFDRISARRAVALATDRAEILARAFDGQGSIARGMVSETSPWFADFTTPVRDVDRARRQVEEYAKETGQPLKFHLLVPPDPTLQRVASVWRLQLADAGIDLVVDVVDPSAAGLIGATGQFQAMLQIGFAAAHPDAYYPLFRGIPAEQPVIGTNITRYIDPLVTKAFTDARTTADSTRRIDDYRTVQEQLSIDLPYLFLVQMRQVIVTTPSVRDLTSWRSASGAAGLGQDDATVSLAQVRLAR